VGVSKVPGPNYDAMRGTFLLTKNDNAQATLYPEKRSYFSSTMPMTEAAIDVGLTRDIYVSLGEVLNDQSWAVRVYYKPFVDWIWGGCLLMALGGLLAISDKRYRMKLKKAAK
jgi:cytochrome c-type biogenesis protein CcmF